MSILYGLSVMGFLSRAFYHGHSVMGFLSRAFWHGLSIMGFLLWAFYHGVSMGLQKARGGLYLVMLLGVKITVNKNFQLEREGEREREREWEGENEREWEGESERESGREKVGGRK